MYTNNINDLRKKIENILQDNKAIEIKTIDLKYKTQIIIKELFYKNSSTFT